MLIIKKLHKSQKGVVTIDYLFSFVLIGGFSVLVFALSLTLTVVELTQYITFASARHHYASNMDSNAQSQHGQAKFQELVSNPVFLPLIENGWFELDQNTLVVGPDIPQGREDLAAYRDVEDRFNLFHGTVIWFQANVLGFTIPFFGSTVLQDQQGSFDNFGAYIGSYLGRETTYLECRNFMVDRWEAIQNLPTEFGASYAEANRLVDENHYRLIMDNGC